MAQGLLFKEDWQDARARPAEEQVREAVSMRKIVGWMFVAAVAAACGSDRGDVHANAQPGEARGSWAYDELSREDIERGRRDPAWRQVVHFEERVDTLDVEWPESWEDITVASVNGGVMRLPVRGDGSSAFRVQSLLDQALFSPGIIDGRWGKNTEKAVYWFQSREGLRTTGEVDEATFERLIQVAGAPQQIAIEHTLSEDDVAGPFVRIPRDIYEHARLDCSCYESLREKLGERFHADPEVLEKLNPGIDLNALSAGDRLHVPRVRPANVSTNAGITELVVSGRGHYVHAIDATGRIVFHFPSTLGSSYDPSPAGDHRVVSITEDPWWHYQPSILAHVDDNKPEARIPPGPNNAVGLVWMALSKPHYGIHGTNSPETIGYATSAGCVRLTNWDALFLARRIDDGVKVSFRDT
jgi:lipoprotein-anchoring transpeptidase ErfK/SrfK